METFSALKNQARVAAGLKGGDQFKNPMTFGPMTFTGWPSEVEAKFAQSGKMIPTPKPLDVWNSRRSNGSI